MKTKKEFHIHRLTDWRDFWKFLVEVQKRIMSARKITREFKIVFEYIKNNTSNKQRSYYFGVIIPMIKEKINSYGNNMDEEDVHLFLKDELKFYTMPAVEIKGRKTAVRKKYKTISFKGDMRETYEYFERIRSWALNILEVDIPEPKTERK